MNSGTTKIIVALGCAIVFVLASGCDPERKKKCEWTLMPEPEDAHRQAEGYYAVCARNFVNNRQKCNMQVRQATAKDIYGKYFRLADVEIESEGKFPRKITSIKLCEKED